MEYCDETSRYGMLKDTKKMGNGGPATEIEWCHRPCNYNQWNCSADKYRRDTLLFVH